MKILRSRSVASLKKDFSALYPGLKIEFYEKPHKAYTTSSADFQLHDQALLEMATQEGEIDLDPAMTVEEVEQKFESDFGLHIQIYRQSKELWLQTSATDHWTLEVQNRKGIHSTT